MANKARPSYAQLRAEIEQLRADKNELLEAAKDLLMVSHTGPRKDKLYHVINRIENA